MKNLRIAAVALAAVALGGTQVVAKSQQDPPPQTAQQLFEAGEYDAALARLADRAEGEAMSPQDHYLEALILLRKMPPENDRAKDQLAAIAESGNEGWTKTAESARRLIDGDTGGAIDAANQAAALAPDLFAAHYQLGLAKAKMEDWNGAAAAFERASEIDPSFAYAHYYAGIAYSRLRRADREAQHFETFVKLAPKAPERLAVESILRTLRGR